LQAVGAETVRDGRGEQFNVVSKAACAELAEIRQVLAQLRGLNTGGLGERVTRNGANAIALEALQATKIDRKPVDSFARDLGIFFQALVNEHQFVRQQ
jgi:hypothetical protein